MIKKRFENRGIPKDVWNFIEGYEAITKNL
jgi:hypothetical protein